MEIKDMERHIKKHLPEFYKAVKQKDADHVIMHHVAFGVDLEELYLMGMAIKYAGMNGKRVHVLGGEVHE